MARKNAEPQVTVEQIEQALADHHTLAAGPMRSAANFKQLAQALARLTPAVLAIASGLGVKIPVDPIKIAALVVQLNELFKGIPDALPAPE